MPLDLEIANGRDVWQHQNHCPGQFKALRCQGHAGVVNSLLVQHLLVAGQYLFHSGLGEANSNVRATHVIELAYCDGDHLSRAAGDGRAAGASVDQPSEILCAQKPKAGAKRRDHDDQDANQHPDTLPLHECSPSGRARVVALT